MSVPQTISDVLQMLLEYHKSRCQQYRKLAQTSPDEQTRILLEHLVELDESAAKIIRLEISGLPPGQTTYLTHGPAIGNEVTHAVDCKCDAEPNFYEALNCAFTSDRQLDELLDRLEGCTAATSVVELAKRIREMEQTKDRQIANFTRMD